MIIGELKAASSGLSNSLLHASTSKLILSLSLSHPSLSIPNFLFNVQLNLSYTELTQFSCPFMPWIQIKDKSKLWSPGNWKPATISRKDISELKHLKILARYYTQHPSGVITAGDNTGPGWLFWFTEEKNWHGQNSLAFYPGPVLPPTADGSPFPGDKRLCFKFQSFFNLINGC